MQIGQCVPVDMALSSANRNFKEIGHCEWKWSCFLRIGLYVNRSLILEVGFVSWNRNLGEDEVLSCLHGPIARGLH